MKRVCLIVCLTYAAACAPQTPQNLTPTASIAFNNLRVQNVLDQIRDIAQAANAATPPVLSTATTRKVTLWHESAIKVIHTDNAGWQATVTASLDELLKDLPPAEVQLLTPYVNFAKGIIKGVA